MAQSKHTPAPWRISERQHPQNACIEIVAGEFGGDDIATLYGPDHGVTQDENGVWSDHPVRVANAHLIVAAPDMLAMLRECRATFTFAADAGDSEAAQFIEQIDAVIAKATGEVR